MTFRPWSDQETLAAQAMWAEGVSASKIARQLPGRSRNSVLGRLHRLGFTRDSDPTVVPSPEHRIARAKFAERNAQIIKEYRGGLIVRELAAKFSLSEGRIADILTENKIRLTRAQRSRRMKRVARIRAGFEHKGGRRPAWPNCPPELKPEYMRLRKSYGIRAAEARAMLEVGA